MGYSVNYTYIPVIFSHIFTLAIIRPQKLINSRHLIFTLLTLATFWLDTESVTTFPLH